MTNRFNFKKMEKQLKKQLTKKGRIKWEIQKALSPITSKSPWENPEWESQNAAISALEIYAESLLILKN